MSEFPEFDDFISCLKMKMNYLFEAIQILLPECRDEKKADAALALIKEAGKLK